MRWMREVTDVRVHGTTAEPPALRFERDERQALTPLGARAPFLQVRELVRQVHSDACIELDTNRYSVPWKLVGESVSVVAAGRQVRVFYAGHEVTCHAQNAGGRVSMIERMHSAGIVGAKLRDVSWLFRPSADALLVVPPAALRAELLRPLAEYEHAVGGRW